MALAMPPLPWMATTVMSLKVGIRLDCAAPRVRS